MSRPTWTPHHDLGVKLLLANYVPATGAGSTPDVELVADWGGAEGCAFVVLIDDAEPGAVVQAYIRQKWPGGAWENLTPSTLVQNTPGQGGLLMTEIIRPLRPVLDLWVIRSTANSRITAVYALVHTFRRPLTRFPIATFPGLGTQGYAWANAPGTDG